LENIALNAVLALCEAWKATGVAQMNKAMGQE